MCVARRQGELRVKVGYEGNGVGSRISRSGIVAFILKQLEDDTCVRQVPVISN